MVSASPHERVARVLPELYALTPIECYPAHALRVVRRVVDGEKTDYTEVELTTGAFRVLVDPEPPQLRGLADARRAHMAEHPVLNHFLSSIETEPRQISDFLTPREFHRIALYGEFFDHLGVEDQLTVAVIDHHAQVGFGVSVDRPARSFHRDDRRLMSLLRPHLLAARRNAVNLSRALAGASAALSPGAANALDRLTDRQLEVLSQASNGLTNEQIGLALDISIGTARKHMEHILRRLGVSSRTAAAVQYLTVNAKTNPPATTWTATLEGLKVG